MADVYAEISIAFLITIYTIINNTIYTYPLLKRLVVLVLIFIIFSPTNLCVTQVSTVRRSLQTYAEQRCVCVQQLLQHVFAVSDNKWAFFLFCRGNGKSVWLAGVKSVHSCTKRFVVKHCLLVAIRQLTRLIDNRGIQFSCLQLNLKRKWQK